MTTLPDGGQPLRVVATIPTKPEAAETVRAGLAELAHATRREEGCLAYDVFESQSAPGTFVTIEAWRHPSDLDAHKESPHLAAALALLTDTLTGDVAIHPLAPLP